MIQVRKMPNGIKKLNMGNRTSRYKITIQDCSLPQKNSHFRYKRTIQDGSLPQKNSHFRYKRTLQDILIRVQSSKYQGDQSHGLPYSGLMIN